MSLSAIKPWFQKRLYAQNFEEHTDGFNIDNIGGLDLDRVWHFNLNTVNGFSINHTDQRTESDVEIQVYFRGGRDAAEAIETAIIEIESIVKECCNIKNRTSDGILNVIFQRAEIVPRGDGNDSSVLVKMAFTVVVLIGVEE